MVRARHGQPAADYRPRDSTHRATHHHANHNNHNRRDIHYLPAYEQHSGPEYHGNHGYDHPERFFIHYKYYPRPGNDCCGNDYDMADYDYRRPDYCYGCTDTCAYECPDYKHFDQYPRRDNHEQYRRRDDHYCHNCTVFAPRRCPAHGTPGPGEPV